MRRLQKKKHSCVGNVGNKHDLNIPVISGSKHWILTLSYSKIHQETTEKHSQPYAPVPHVEAAPTCSTKTHWFPDAILKNSQIHPHLVALAGWGMVWSSGFNRTAQDPAFGNSDQIFCSVLFSKFKSGCKTSGFTISSLWNSNKGSVYWIYSSSMHLKSS